MPATPAAHRGAEVVRIGNGSGFYGDRHEAMLELVEGGPLDVLTGDYLAELTMLILWRAKQRDAERGYARSFLSQARRILRPCLDRGIRIVVNAGGLNPVGLSSALRELAHDLDLTVSIAHVDGDDLIPRLDRLRAAGHQLANTVTGVPLAEAGAPPLTVNAYLGATGIVTALDAGAQIVVTGRVTDASLAVGPARWWFGWPATAHDALAGATVAGHVIECGAQACGGNLGIPGPTALDDPARPALPGYPIAEIAADGSSVITKHPGTGGEVSVDSVTAQLLYEIDGPRYLGPDVVSRFDTVTVSRQGPDRVAIGPVLGEPPPAIAKVAATVFGGWRNAVTFLLTGAEVARKRALLERQVAEVVDLEAIAQVEWRLGPPGDPSSQRNDGAATTLTLTVTDPDPDRVSRRAFADPIVGIALASYAGCTLTAPPTDAQPVGRYWPTTIDADVLTCRVVVDGQEVPSRDTAGSEVVSPANERRDPIVGSDASEPATGPDTDVVTAPSAPTEPATHPTVRVPLGTVVGARSGDKGGDANVGLWVDRDERVAWLLELVADEAGRRALLPEAEGLVIDVHPLPRLRAVNLVVRGLLGEGVAGSTRPDPQAKGLAEYVRSRPVDVPTTWVETAGSWRWRPDGDAAP